jgi:ribonuclease T2
MATRALASRCRLRLRSLLLPLAALSICFVLAPATHAQHKGEPGKFDFYLMNLSSSQDFCSIQGTSPDCSAPPGFILHGLWAQNNDGTYPVFCSDEPGPADPRQNLDITPDLALLQHEWAKHGTCSGVGPQRFFDLEHRALRSLSIPPQIEYADHVISMTPHQILGLFAEANPDFPRGSILLSCGRNKLTAIEACLGKDLKPIACKGLFSCRAPSVEIDPPAQSR